MPYLEHPSFTLSLCCIERLERRVPCEAESDNDSKAVFVEVFMNYSSEERNILCIHHSLLLLHITNFTYKPPTHCLSVHLNIKAAEPREALAVDMLMQLAVRSCVRKAWLPKAQRDVPP
ncbi:hypothetical protein MHYP_G00146590 [Metynnis hypsauchen]